MGADQPRGQQWGVGASLPRHEGDGEDDSCPRGDEDERVRGPTLFGAGQGKQRRGDCCGSQRGTRQVQTAQPSSSGRSWVLVERRPRQDHVAEPEEQQAWGDGEAEGGPRPAQLAGDDATEDGAGHSAGGPRHGPCRERPATPRVGGEGPRGETERWWVGQGGPGALQQPRADKHRPVPREGGQHGAASQQRLAGQQDRAAAVEVAEPSREQQPAGQGEGVGRDHPRQPGRAHRQVSSDRRQRQGHGEAVQDHEELHTGQHQHQQRRGSQGRGWARGTVLGSRERRRRRARSGQAVAHRAGAGAGA